MILTSISTDSGSKETGAIGENTVAMRCRLDSNYRNVEKFTFQPKISQ